MPKRTAVVLGASGGIGLGCAKELAAAGHRVVLFARDAAKLQAAKEQVPGSELISGDINDAASLGKLFQTVDEKWGGCDILVNNNGGPKPGDLMALTDADWTEGFASQALPVFRAIRRVLSGMTKVGWGRIITIGSISARQPLENLDLSNFMRAGLAGVTRTLARKVAAQGVTVHLVCPGSILTERSRGRIEARAQKTGISFEDSLKQSQASIPMGRLGTAEEVGALVAFLASDKAAYLTGNVIQVDGGLVTGLP